MVDKQRARGPDLPTKRPSSGLRYNDNGGSSGGSDTDDKGGGVAFSNMGLKGTKRHRM